MGSIFTSMVNTSEAMRTMQRALGVVQNNIINASTPGYARQEQRLIANPFNPDAALSGGISAGPVDSTRSAYAESSVWRLQHRAGYAAQMREQLTRVEQSFPIGASAGIAGELDRFFAVVSQWSISPNSMVSRRQVLDQAGKLAQSFNGTALELGNARGQAIAELNGTVEKINRLAADIVSINTQRRQSLVAADDAGLDAQLHNKLEELSQLAEFTAMMQPDGTVSVYLNGRTPLVVGDREWPLSLANASGQYQVLDGTGADITWQFAQGKIASLLELTNTILPGWQSELDTLAQTFADQVNGLLATGIDANGNPPPQGLFAYSTTPGAAVTLSVTSLSAAGLAGAAPGDPGGNTVALALSELGSSRVAGGFTFSQSYGELAASIGDKLAEAGSRESLQQQLLQQANALREDLSGVDINVEAAKLLELQRGFQAAGQVMSVLNSLTETLLGMVR